MTVMKKRSSSKEFLRKFCIKNEKSKTGKEGGKVAPQWMFSKGILIFRDRSALRTLLDGRSAA
jgi:hypothetical protein